MKTIYRKQAHIKIQCYHRYIFGLPMQIFNTVKAPVQLHIVTTNIILVHGRQAICCIKVVIFIYQENH